MRCLDTTFLIDLLRADPEARKKAEALDEAGERLTIAAPSLAEVLVGAHFKGGKVLEEALALVSALDVLEVDARVAGEAGRLGAELLRRGTAMASVDLLIAATSKMNGCILVTRDSTFQQIPDLPVEAY